MPKIIAYDIMRLFIGPAFLTPRGIDRVDFALARHIFSAKNNASIGILPTPFGVYAFSSTQVERLLNYLGKIWAEESFSGDDQKLQNLFAKMRSKDLRSDRKIPVQPLFFRNKVQRMLKMLYTTKLFPRGFAIRTVPANAIYLNVGQLGLAMPSFFNWLSKRPDIISTIMLHDAIPIKHPQLVSPTATNYHKQMIKTAAKRAHYLIFNSNCTRKNVNEVMLELGLSCPPSLVRSLPLPAAYLGDVATLTNLSGTRYFVAVSTVEPRKNYTLLLRIWERFIVTMGAAAPHLVIVGSPGKGAEQILAPLKLDADLAGRVHHVIGLSSPSLAALVLGATGMLCPSFAEGFGLPVLEASAMGVPTIASDIPAHREVAATTTILLAPDDEDAWMSAIAATPNVTKRSRPDIPYALTEDAYSADIMKFISDMRTSATTLARLT